MGRLEVDSLALFSRCKSANQFTAQNHEILTRTRVIEQPFKVPFVAAVALVANSQNAEAGKLIVEEAGKAVQQCLVEGTFTRVKLLLRFLGCVQGMLEESGVYPLLNSIVDKATASLAEGEVGLALELTKTALIAVPYVLASSKDDVELAKELLEKTEPLSKVKHKMQSLLNPFTGDGAPYDDQAKGTHVSIFPEYIEDTES